MPGFLSRVLDDAEFARKSLAIIPEILRGDAEREYSRRYALNNRDGNLWLLGLTAFSRRQGARDYSRSDEVLCERARMLAANPLTAQGRTEQQIRRHLRRQQRRGIEMIAYKIGTVGGRPSQQKYCSGQTVALRRQQVRRWLRYAERTQLRRGSQAIRLSEILTGAADRLAAERYCMTKGLQEVAEADGMQWSFWTFTAPPRFHPSPSHGKCRWDDELSPQDAHDWIAQRWAWIRAALAKFGITLAGVRVVEAHNDGCPHWHLAIYYRPEHANRIRETISRYFRIVDRRGRELRQWARAIRRARDGWTELEVSNAREEVGDRGRGQFVTYMFKYLNKTLSSGGAVDAWRSTWGVRAYQFFGLPPLNLWRELRRQTQAPANERVAHLWRCARGNRAAEFIRLAGGLAEHRDDRPFRITTLRDDVAPERIVRHVPRGLLPAGLPDRLAAMHSPMVAAETFAPRLRQFAVGIVTLTRHGAEVEPVPLPAREKWTMEPAAAAPAAEQPPACCCGAEPQAPAGAGGVTVNNRNRANDARLQLFKVVQGSAPGGRPNPPTPPPSGYIWEPWPPDGPLAQPLH
ncbi:MAG: replication endonuclease [Denitromonas halophila]|nr:MAG: replication endonuclease [Denitromonas halophila]